MSVANCVASTKRIPVAGFDVQSPVSPGWGASASKVTVFVPKGRHWSVPALAKEGPWVAFVVITTSENPGAGQGTPVIAALTGFSTVQRKV